MTDLGGYQLSSPVSERQVLEMEARMEAPVRKRYLVSEMTEHEPVNPKEQIQGSKVRTRSRPVCDKSNARLTP
jgi:hypothetical protein